MHYSGEKAVDVTLTQSELNAWMNKDYAYTPVDHCQLRINQDGTAELSGIIRTDNLESYVKAVGASTDNLKVLTDNLKYVKGNPPFYMKGTGSVVNSQISLDLQEVKIGKLTIPSSQIQENKANIIHFVQWEIGCFPGFSVKSFSFMPDGKVRFNGTLPASVSLSPSK